MTEPTKEQYAHFGEAVAGILDGHSINLKQGTVEQANAALAFTVKLAAQVYGIETQEHA